MDSIVLFEFHYQNSIILLFQKLFNLDEFFLLVLFEKFDLEFRTFILIAS